MTLESAIEAELPYLRAEAEARMLDTVEAFSPDGDTTDADDYQTSGYQSHGTFPARIAGRGGARDMAVTAVVVDDIERELRVATLHLPISSPVPTVGKYGTGWEYVVTSVGPLTDPALLNTRWLMMGSPFKSQATARRLDVIQVV